MLNENLAPRDILSEGLKYHMNNNKPLTEHVYRAGSENYFNLWAEARSLYSRQILEITNEDDLEILTETDLGHYGMFEGKKVPLDFPIELTEEEIDEAKKDIYSRFLDNPQNPKGRAKSIISKFLKRYGEGATQMNVDWFSKQNNLKPEEKYILKYITKNDISITSQPGGPNLSALNEQMDLEDELANMEFGMDYDQLGDNEKEWVRDEMDNMSMNEVKDKPLNKPMRDSSGGKAYKVYVKDPKTKKIKTVRFGSGGLRAKINDKEARNAFAARHKCSTKKDKTKAGYWSCRLPRYAKLLGLKSNFGGFW